MKKLKIEENHELAKSQIMSVIFLKIQISSPGSIFKIYRSENVFFQNFEMIVFQVKKFQKK